MPSRTSRALHPHATARAEQLQHRQLLYTALTRGKRLVFLVATAKALKTAVTSAPAARHSLLQPRLIDQLVGLHLRGGADTVTPFALAELLGLPARPPGLPLPYPDVALPAQLQQEGAAKKGRRGRRRRASAGAGEAGSCSSSPFQSLSSSEGSLSDGGSGDSGGGA